MFTVCGRRGLWPYGLWPSWYIGPSRRLERGSSGATVFNDDTKSVGLSSQHDQVMDSVTTL